MGCKCHWKKKKKNIMGDMNITEYIITYSLFVAYTQICKNKTVEYLLICGVHTQINGA